MGVNISIEKLLYEEEGPTLDFKERQYKFSNATDDEKGELLKDILAFSNAWRRTNAYILIGVKEVKGGKSIIVGIEDDLDDASLQQFVNSKTNHPISFEYKAVLHDEKKIGVLEVGIQNRPIYLNKDDGKLKKLTVYLRRGSSTAMAEPGEISGMGRADVIDSPFIPSLYLEFADVSQHTSLGKALSVKSTVLDLSEWKEIPDFSDSVSNSPLGAVIQSINMRSTNSDYYRDLVKFHYARKKSSKIGFLLTNGSTQVVTDIKIELIVDKTNDFTFVSRRTMPDIPESHSSIMAPIRPLQNMQNEVKKSSVSIHKLDDYFRIEIDFQKVQPKQTVFLDDVIYLASNESHSTTLAATIYADNIPQPITTTLKVNCDVSHSDGSLESVLGLHKKYLAALHNWG